MVTSDHSSLPVCRDGPQARSTKECVAFQPQSYGKGGMEEEYHLPFWVSFPGDGPKRLIPLNRPLRLRRCLGCALYPEARFARVFHSLGCLQHPLRLRIRFGAAKVPSASTMSTAHALPQHFWGPAAKTPSPSVLRT